MKVDRILLLTCDRPDYLIQSIDRILKLGIEVVAVLDKPSNLEKIKAWKECEKILKSNNIKFIKNKENIGCSNSMYLLLDQRTEGVNLIIEDDIILKDEFDLFVENYKESSNFIMKLSSFYWGWLADYIAIDKFKAFRNQENEDVSADFKKTTYWKAIEIFQKSNTFFPFDELLDTCIGFKKINEIKGLDLTVNIGEISSRKNNKKEGEVKFVLFKNGVIHKMNG